jgi:alkylation response protein AidB-like acyl-CoA dehydrogenase
MLSAMKNTRGGGGMAADKQDWRRRAAEFAKAKIATRPELHELECIPAELWQDLGEAGFMGLALPLEYGGAGGDWPLLVEVAEALAHHGGCPGVVTSWMGHQLISRLHVLRLATEMQKDLYLRELASGRLTPCLAISEPGAGAHPKMLSTSAERDGDDVVINGEKAYLTNGPIAGLFLVLAIDEIIDGRKRFSVYAVPADTPGVERTQGIHVDFLKPSPHCGLKLTDARVPVSSRLGPAGDAFAAISLPMRRVEDAIFAGSMAGTLRRRLELLAGAMGAAPTDKEILSELGSLITLPDGLLALARQGARMIEADATEDHAGISAIAAAARQWVAAADERIGVLVQNCAIQETAEMAYLRRDVAGILKIAGAAHQIQAAKRAAMLFNH